MEGPELLNEKESTKISLLMNILAMMGCRELIYMRKCGPRYCIGREGYLMQEQFFLALEPHELLFETFNGVENGFGGWRVEA